MMTELGKVTVPSVDNVEDRLYKALVIINIRMDGLHTYIIYHTYVHTYMVLIFSRILLVFKVELVDLFTL
jgi:hypothetical protein